MPRAGGGGGGGHSFGGGHSMGHSGGGHSLGGSRSGGSFGGSRAGSGSSGRSFSGGSSRRSYSSGRGYSGGMGPMFGGPRVSRRRNVGGMGGAPVAGGGMGCGGGCLTTILVVVFALILIAFIGSMMGSGSSSSGGLSTVTNTKNREKIESGNAYINDCIIDELGWFDNISKTESELKEFWEDTGVQPYIILKAYDSSLKTNDQKQDWANSYYDDNFTTENIFLYVYFAEEDTDNDVGRMVYTNGLETSSVMDSEAVEIFWNYIDKYWYSDLSTDELFITVFTKTGDTIMTRSTTSNDVALGFVVLLVVVAIGVTVVVVIKKKNERAREKAKEDQEILNTPIDDMIKDKTDDPTDKYL
ncbi:MAG: hypothetical protein K6F37_09925 [Lachnospiraceae bacterium]|nr:hypothetical protein [Lachnospiraceae bacterium]